MPHAAPTELEKHLATVSINIPRLRRFRIREFAGSIIRRRFSFKESKLKAARTQGAPNVSRFQVTELALSNTDL
jgi:hypothetical protein